MEMESSRRIFDRSREPGLKKPRLSDESERNQGMNRPFTSAQRPVSNNPMISRFRASERETDSGAGASGRGGGGYQPQPIPAVALQQHQELVSQYRAALAELTFNSKPIITNLTIIAGENVNAAKAIASTICANIIEVPGDMKLPSLYLLDSIVKNIGRDYIKHFAVKLPEVFCKAYRQVEPPIHQSMRHLFGTWKGVFPLHTLQMIEKDLGFTSTINGTPAVSTTPRPDSQASRPSIHVNPKYFERHLQQPTRVKGLSGDVTGSIANSLEDEESLDRATSISSSRSWVDPSAKTHNMQQRPLRGHETIQEKNISAEYADYDYGSDFSRNSGLGVDRPSARVVEQGLEKPWYADGSSLPESLPGQRNSFNTKHGFPNYSAPKSVNSISHLQSAKNMSNRSRGGISSDSWKNSDEEEFRWGDMTTRLTVHGASDVSSNFRKERSTSVDSERSGLEDNIHRPQSMHDYPSRIPKEVSAEPKEFSALPHRVSSPWLSRDSQPVDELSHPGTASFGYPGNGVLGPARAPPHQRLQSPKSELPPLRQHPPLKTEQDRLRTQSLGHSDHKVSQFPEKVNMGIHDPCSHDTPIPPSHTRPSKVVKSQAYEALPSSTIPGIQQKYRYPIPQQVEDSTDSEPLNQTPKLDNFAPDRLNANPVTSIEDPSPSSLLAAVLKSGVLPSLNLQNSGQVSSQKGRSPAPSGPTSLDPRSKVAPSSSKSHSLNGSKSASVKISKKKVETLSPLSLSPLDSVPEKTSKDVKSSPHPISDLLSSLVAKGLISAIKTESPTQIPKKAVASSTEKKKKSPSVIAKTSSVVSSKASTKTVLSKKDDEPSVADPSPKTAVSLPGPVKSEVKSLIGFDFKPDVIRVFHQNVVDDLLEGYEYCCTVCGLRMKLQEQLNRHLELHGTEKTKSRKWFANISDSGGSGLGETYSDSEDEHDKDELMVIADESSCVCVLCGKIFEDFYCQETDEWMFRGATHLMVPPEGKQGSLRKGPIVHAKCISESSLQDLGLATGIKMETDV